MGGRAAAVERQLRAPGPGLPLVLERRQGQPPLTEEQEQQARPGRQLELGVAKTGPLVGHPWKRAVVPTLGRPGPLRQPLLASAWAWVQYPWRRSGGASPTRERPKRCWP